VSLTRTVLREQIRELLLERILKGELQPGDRIVELQIAQELGTSQAPVREALRELQSLGFVEHEPYRGTRVRRIIEEELAEIYPVRAALKEGSPEKAGGALRQHFETLQTMMKRGVNA
jgi:DNA-binding GntR family transcriptional regulator